MFCCCLYQSSPFSIIMFKDIAVLKLRLLFLIQGGMFNEPKVLLSLALSKLHNLIHRLYLTNHSSQEPLYHGTHCCTLLFLNPTTYHLSHLPLTNLILSLCLLNLSPFSLFFLCQGTVVGYKAFSNHYLLGNKV